MDNVAELERRAADLRRFAAAHLNAKHSTYWMVVAAANELDGAVRAETGQQREAIIGRNVERIRAGARS